MSKTFPKVGLPLEVIRNIIKDLYKRYTAPPLADERCELDGKEPEDKDSDIY